MGEAIAPNGHHFRHRAGAAYAALDLGTNNCRLLVGAQAGDGFRVLDSFSRIVRLGEGLHDSGRLADRAMDRALEALHACAQRLERRPLRGLRTDGPGGAGNNGADIPAQTVNSVSTYFGETPVFFPIALHDIERVVLVADDTEGERVSTPVVALEQRLERDDPRTAA